ncbi:hypothetical protein [Halorubrum sp. CBA1229]|uniref:hypothetical protein n=1 Tax=Halorubrum sp. CBA1229 TaxID=1853699 RepID=UPI0011CD4B91|nr:hypothetical protein [Halorubrum sp. CBA1229]QKY15577.1 hypothetical protein Hrr1229_001275 [Halorubrum sp. CBA1229]
MRVRNLNSNFRSGLIVLILIFSIRLIGVGVTIYTGQNPYAQADVIGFIASAEEIAIGLENGNYVNVDRPTAYQRWGAFLAPFWLLPGPSLVYASIVNALIGSLAAYNVYTIAQYYHSRSAAVVSIVPLMIYPSIVLVHSTLLREAVVLFGITAATKSLLIPNHRSQSKNIIIVVGGLFVAGILRPDNIPLYIIAIGVGTFVHIYYLDIVRNIIMYMIILGGATSTLFFLNRIQEGISYLANLREVRTRGRTAYLVDIYATQIPEAIAFSGIGVAYFLCSPFPWMISNVSDFVVGVEALVNLIFILISPLGFRVLFQRNPAGAVGLGTGVIVGVILYALATGNVGTAVRHRQMFMWVFFLLGGIGITQHTQIKTNNNSR